NDPASTSTSATMTREVRVFIAALLLNAPRDDRVRRRTAQEATAAGRHGDVLFAVLPEVRGRNRVRRCLELIAPQFLAAARINRTEDPVDRRADEHEVAGRCDPTSQTRRAR